MDDRYAIHLGKSEIREGYRTGDVERILAQYADGFSDFSSGFPTFGREDSKIVLRERLTALFARHSVTLVPVAVEIVLMDAAALQFGWHELKFAPHTGEPVFQRRSRYFELWRKDEKSGWRIAAFHDNEDQAPRMAEEIVAALRTGRLDAATRSWARDEDPGITA